MIEENIFQREKYFSPLRVYDVASGLLGACDIPASQAITLATMIVRVFSEWEIITLERQPHEEAD